MSKLNLKESPNFALTNNRRKKKKFLLLLIFLSGFFFSQEYKPDILGNGFEQKTLNFPNDYEGKVTATVIRKKAASPAKKQCCIFTGLTIIFFRRKWQKNSMKKGLTFMLWI